MSDGLCGCGCGEPVNPGKRYVFAHYPRTVQGLPYEARQTAPPSSLPCECGCGKKAKPGNRYLAGHYSASLRRGTPRRTRTARCPRCGMSAVLRDDDTFGTHWNTQRKTAARRRCPEGGLPAPKRRPRPGRRVTLTVDVVLPDGWDVTRFQAEAAQVLRNYLDEPFVVGLDVSEEAS
jgi:hypothetical protein